MYDDYEFNAFDCEISCHDYLDETYGASYAIQHNTYELDEDYARDSCDYTELAYKHYA